MGRTGGGVNRLIDSDLNGLGGLGERSSQVRAQPDQPLNDGGRG